MILTAAVMLLGLAWTPLHGQEKKKELDKNALELEGFIKEALSRKDLLKAKVTVTDSAGNMIDTLTTGGYYSWDSGTNRVVEMAYYSFKVPRREATYVLEIELPGYQTLVQPVTVSKIGKREFSRALPNYYMQRAPRQLGEVTVQASKVKFYNRGDTIVFNADAFELAEGSMLDALVKQLPGVELREGGQIYVNGEYVENLMLNGKDFFKGNNELMLDNLASYTVKDIEVYKRASDEDRWAGVDGKKSLTMDVKLKHEYNVGWIINLEAGGGTEKRYMGRAFINRFTNNSRISLIANINNLNDNRKPGESSTWTPQNNTAGTMRTQMGAIDYSAQHPEALWKSAGNVLVRHTSQDDWRDVQRVNFLTGGNTYDYTFSNNKSKEWTVNTSHEFTVEKQRKYYGSIRAGGEYRKTNSDASTLGGTFSSERSGMTRNMLDSLYLGSPADLTDVINRTRTQTLNSGHSLSGSLSASMSYAIPNTNDYAFLSSRLSYNSGKNEVWRDYKVNYGADPVPAIRDNQYFDNTPNRVSEFGFNTGYRYAFSEETRLGIIFDYEHTDSHKDSYMYALDRLADQGVIGTLPEGYLSTINGANSYRSHTIQNTYTPSISFSTKILGWRLYAAPSLKIVDQNFHYFRDSRDYYVNQKRALVAIGKYRINISRMFSPFKFNGRDNYRHYVEGYIYAQQKLPDAADMVDVTDDSDPMNIWKGNPDLKSPTELGANVRWDMTLPVGSRMFSNTVDLIYENTRNALVSGYTYNTSTGVRVNKHYNVKAGNYVAKIHVSPRLQFGNKSQFTAFYRGGLDYMHSTDMIGVNAESPTPSSVYTYWQAHTVNVAWTLGKQQLTFQAQMNRRYTNSTRADFNSITATDANLLLQGQFKLPKGFGISTDFTVYMRRGYGSPELDTTDPVWNARLSYTPPKSNWVIMLDGFDMLHQLSNVTYSVNAQGRTVAYTNVLPRYMMLHVQYRINIQPKKKIIDNTVRRW